MARVAVTSTTASGDMGSDSVAWVAVTSTTARGTSAPLTSLLFPRAGGKIPHSLQMVLLLLSWGTGTAVWFPRLAGSLHCQPEASVKDLGATHHLWSP